MELSSAQTTTGSGALGNVLWAVIVLSPSACFCIVRLVRGAAQPALAAWLRRMVGDCIFIKISVNTVGSL